MVEATRTDTTQGHDTTQSHDTTRDRWIRVPTLIATVPAAVIAALLASFLGVAGTLVGTALVSLVVTFARDVGRHSIKQTIPFLKEQMRRPAGGSDESAESQQHGGVDEPADSQASDEPRRSFLAPLRRGPGRRLGWKRGLAVAAAVFVLSIGIVTAVEAVAGAPLSHLIGGTGSSGGTTVSRVFSGHSHSHHEPGSKTSNHHGDSPSSKTSNNQ
jgi:hypothetical protein